MSEKLSLPIARKRTCRRVAISSITHLEKHVLKLEAKDKLSRKAEVAVTGFIKTLENLDADFKWHYCNIIDSVEENEGVLLEEEAKLDDHKDRLTNFMSHLLEFEVGEEKVAMSSAARLSNSSFTLQIDLHGIDPFRSGSIQRNRLQPIYTRLLNWTRSNQFNPACSVNATRLDLDRSRWDHQTSSI